MLAKLGFGVKLIAAGTLVMILPLAAVALLTVGKTTQGLAALENEQLAARAADCAAVIDNVFEEEKKVATYLALDPFVVDAAVGIGQSRGAAIVAAANDRLSALAHVKGLGDGYQVLLCIGPDGTPIASSDHRYDGSSYADKAFFRNAMEGMVDAGSAGINAVTRGASAPISAPIRSGDRIVGAFVAMADISFLTDLITEERIGMSGYAFIVDGTGMIIAHPKHENIFTVNIAKQQGMEDLARRMIGGQSGIQAYAVAGAPAAAGYAPVKATGWSVAMTIPESEFLAPAAEVRRLTLVISAAALLAAFLVFLPFARSVARPLARAVVFAQKVAAGDLSMRLDIGRTDEVGRLADALNDMSQKLRSLVAIIQESAHQVASSSEEITAGSEQLAGGAQRQALTLEQTNAAVTLLTASVDRVAGHAQSQSAAVEQGVHSMAMVNDSLRRVSDSLSDISALAAQSVTKALEGAKTVEEVMAGISRIAGGSEKIGGIVDIISDIADQTNLLALNASIEAARAGEHGRGFSVVASEVSKLADRSSVSTREIAALIRESMADVARGVETARGSQAAMEQIRVTSEHVKEMIGALGASMDQQAGAVEELGAALGSVKELSSGISEATRDQAASAHQVSLASGAARDETRAAAAAAEEMSASTEALAQLSQELERLTERFLVVDLGNDGLPALPAGGGAAQSPSPPGAA